MSRERGALTPKQERFVHEYLVDMNATQAAIRAGYSEKTAQEQSSRLLSNVMVSQAIAKGKQTLAETTGVTAKKVIAEMAKIGFSKSATMKTSDKLNALVNLGKHLGLFDERHRLGGLDGGDIQHVNRMEVVFVTPEGKT